MTEQTPDTPTLDLSLSNDPDAKALADKISALPYITQAVLLPDLHIKDGMEAPSSFVTATEGVIAPHLASAALNDGMGLVVTDIDADDVTAEQLDAILVAMNRPAAPTKVSSTKYSWSPEQLDAAMRQGAGPQAKDYGLDDGVLDAVEDRGQATDEPLSEEDIVACMPKFLRRHKFSRSEIGLNFGGNHFLEVQAVDRVVDAETAERFGLAPGKLVVMYHLGPGPLGGNLLNLYAYRRKPPFHRKAGYAFFRWLFQASRGKAFRRLFGGFSDWLVVEEDSGPGRMLATAFHVVKNYGFAYRMGTVRAILDALAEVLNCGQDRAKLLVDISHNILQPERIDGKRLWVSRHNACRPIEGFPGIVAGSNQVPSCITIGPAGCEERLGGYDHGVGILLEKAIAAGEVAPDPRGLTTERVKMIRGTEQVHSRDPQPLLDATVIERAMTALTDANFARPVAYVRPLKTLKHKI